MSVLKTVNEELRGKKATKLKMIFPAVVFRLYSLGCTYLHMTHKTYSGVNKDQDCFNETTAKFTPAAEGPHPEAQHTEQSEPICGKSGHITKADLKRSLGAISNAQRHFVCITKSHQCVF